MDNQPAPNARGATHQIKWFPLRKLLARIAVAFRRAELPRLTQESLIEEACLLETLNRVGNTVAAELNIDRVVQVVTDAATELTGAAFSALFHTTIGENRQRNWLYAVSGAKREAFSDFPMSHDTPLF